MNETKISLPLTNALTASSFAVKATCKGRAPNSRRALISDKFPLFEVFGGTLQCKSVVFAPHIEQLLYHKYTKFSAPSANWYKLPKLQTPIGTVKWFSTSFYKLYIFLIISFCAVETVQFTVNIHQTILTNRRERQDLEIK